MRLLLILASVALAGCGLIKPASEQCDKPAAYANSPEAPPLVVPPGVDAPDTRNALRIPELKTPEKPSDGRCVDVPPSYFPDRTPEQG